MTPNIFDPMAPNNDGERSSSVKIPAEQMNMRTEYVTCNPITLTMNEAEVVLLGLDSSLPVVGLTSFPVFAASSLCLSIRNKGRAASRPTKTVSPEYRKNGNRIHKGTRESDNHCGKTPQRNRPLRQTPAG
jgi:hypothetical protein